jgi:Ca2+/Na+ antiporter
MGQEKSRLKFSRILGSGISWLIIVLLTLWATAALYFDLPFPSLRAPLAAFFLFVVIAVILAIKRQWLRMIVFLACFAIVLVWWLSLQPSNNRPWQPNVDRTAWIDVNGDKVTIHNFRNCDYRAEFDYTCQWEIKTVDLSQLRGADLFFTHWGSPWIAHPILSFDFGDNDHVTFSIETRNQIGRGYSAIRGFFRQYELIYIVADERDVIRLRTNYRTGEEVSLYHFTAGPDRSRAIFLEYVKRVNELHEHPEWYNALTSNCTTNIYDEVAAVDGASQKPWKFHLRLPLNGKDDEKGYERGALAGNLPFPELQRRALINPAAQAADQSPDFSSLIRKNRPGFE